MCTILDCMETNFGKSIACGFLLFCVSYCTMNLIWNLEKRMKTDSNQIYKLPGWTNRPTLLSLSSAFFSSFRIELWETRMKRFIKQSCVCTFIFIYLFFSNPLSLFRLVAFTLLHLLKGWVHDCRKLGSNTTLLDFWARPKSFFTTASFFFFL